MYLTTAVKGWLSMPQQKPELVLCAALVNRCKEMSIEE